jgi:hypothetical protein
VDMGLFPSLVARGRRVDAFALRDRAVWKPNYALVKQSAGKIMLLGNYGVSTFPFPAACRHPWANQISSTRSAAGTKYALVSFR